MILIATGQSVSHGYGMYDMPLPGAVGRNVPGGCGALAAPPRGDARTTAGTWTREGTGRERQRGAVRVSCEELTSRDGAGGTPAPRLGDGRATGRRRSQGDGRTPGRRRSQGDGRATGRRRSQDDCRRGSPSGPSGPSCSSGPRHAPGRKVIAVTLECPC